MKLYKSYLDDMDFIDMDRVTRSYYWDFYLLAWNADADGDLLNRETCKPLTVKNIVLRLRGSTEAVNQALKELSDAGFMELQGDTWNISRYTEEQDNQAEYREKQNERQARKRKAGSNNVTRDSHVTAEQDKLSQENLSKDNLTKEKEKDVTSSLVPSSTELDGRKDEDAPSLKSFEPLEPFKPKNPEHVFRHIASWKNTFGREPDRAILTGIDELLREFIKSQRNDGPDKYHDWRRSGWRGRRTG